MIRVEYQTENDEMVNATLDFIENRPLLKLMLFVMKLSCFLVLVGFMLKCISRTAVVEDFTVVLFALMWIMYRKRFNRYLLRRRLKNQPSQAHKFQVSERRIWWQYAKQQPDQTLWNNIRLVYQNKLGYMIPLSGLQNAAKFLWLPKRSFKKDEEQAFVEIVQKRKLKLKQVK